MKKLILTFVVASLLLGSLDAAEPSFGKGDKVLNLGLGLGSSYWIGYGWYTSHMPHLFANMEIGFFENVFNLDKASIGIGPYVGFRTSKYANYWKDTEIVIAATGNFHYPLVDKLDTYAGVLLGYDIISTKYYDEYWGDYGHKNSSIAHREYVGARYYFTNNFSAMAELGYGLTVLNLGIALKF
ncbi:MAG TPA: hypothetical protein PKL65_07645 [Bacteroidales bacterium]|jgi:hypothetical protein|nr:hypothetical protein [Bacteroidales bacterium]HNR42088.1 hypothetical protein [Bacteroidales bacterium]HQG77097.1 hypothetical protein [Bacteroidales bacterium]